VAKWPFDHRLGRSPLRSGPFDPSTLRPFDKLRVNKLRVNKLRVIKLRVNKLRVNKLRVNKLGDLCVGFKT
jgi:hypothetical protein